MFKDHQTNRLLFLSVLAHMTNCWHLLFQITHIKYHQQHHNLLHPSIAAQFLKFDSTMITDYDHDYRHHTQLKFQSSVLTLLQLCNNRLSKCYGCQWPLKNGDGFPFLPSYNIIGVAKTKRAYRKGGILCEAPPSNVYFYVFHKTRLFHHSLAFKRS